MRFTFFIISLIPFVSCSNQENYQYKGDFPTWDYVNVYNAAEIGDIMTVDTSMVAYRNRIYLTIDSLGDVYLNNHSVEIDKLEQPLKFIYTNPKKLKHLPIHPEKAVFFLAMNFLPKNILNPSIAYNKKNLELNEVFVILQKIILDLQEDFLQNNYSIHFSEADSIQEAEAKKRFPLNLAMYSVFFNSFNDGLDIKLPDNPEEPDNLTLKKRNVFRVVTTSDNKIMVRGEETKLANLKKLTKKFIVNNGLDSNLSESPKRAIISLENAKETEYEVYIAVYNELKAAYDELWNEMALEKYNQPFEKLEKSLQREIRSEIPMVISEADPTAFGE